MGITRSLAWTGAGVLAAAVAGVAWGEHRWRSESERLSAELLAPSQPVPAKVDFARELEHLPPVVTRYFRATLTDGQPMIARAHVRWRGEFNMGKPGRDNWKAFTAEQDFNPAAPGFVWNARIRFAPGVPVLVRDGFVAHQGTMRGAIFGLIPVVSAEPSPDLASGALQRYLGEAAWLPTVLLPSQGVRWDSIDDGRALASITAGATTVSLEFRFDENARLVSLFTPHRMMDDGKGNAVARAWEARILSYMQQDGMTIPGRATAAWHLPEGKFEYWRGTVGGVSYQLVNW